MPQEHETFKVGIDVGGTFTDLFLWGSKGTLETRKTLSTPEDPSLGVIAGLGALAEGRGLDLPTFAAQVTTIVHGTTVTTNATLTRSGARTGLLTTKGVRDALEMRRGVREDHYDNHLQNVVPLVPRHLRLGLEGRLDCVGAELTPLDLAGVREAAQLLADASVDAVAICFLHAYANSAHEAAAATIVREVLPAAYLSVSSELLPTVRFYDRISTTVLNATVGPILQAYLENLTRRLADEAHFEGVLLIMQSNGGVALPELTMQRPAATLLSGPAAGPRGAAAYLEPLGTRDCVVVDMGGTSFDASLLREGEAVMNNVGEIDRLRIALPMLGITTIGAGGGSIGWIDPGGLLRMGPASAGALPGPACYGRGGEAPTCTDANLLLGYLDPEFFAGGQMKLDTGRAHEAIRTHIAEPLGLSVEDAAAGMVRVINANMAHGVREITVKRGVDPREFPLVVAGGAAALHACLIAHELAIPTLLVPPTASVLCAAGMLQSDLRHDFVRSLVGRLDVLDLEKLRTLIEEMAAEGRAQLAREGIDPAAARTQVALDLRYLKQFHEVTVDVSAEAIAAGDLGAIASAFHAAHDALYGYALEQEGTPLELINVRVICVGQTRKPPVATLPKVPPDPSAARKGTRRAFVPEREAFEEIPVFDGHALQHGQQIEGPALIERRDTTLLVSGTFDATIDALGSCHLTRKGAREEDA